MGRRWLPAVLARIRKLAGQRKVLFTFKVLRELAALSTGLDEEDACDVLASLARADFVARVRSRGTGEWMYAFKPTIGGELVYVKVILRAECVVISFHEEEDQSHEDN